MPYPFRYGSWQLAGTFRGQGGPPQRGTERPSETHNPNPKEISVTINATYNAAAGSGYDRAQAAEPRLSPIVRIVDALCALVGPDHEMDLASLSVVPRTMRATR
jgi:hypothetical protein